MYAVSISLGATSSYVAVASVGDGASQLPYETAPVRVIANSNGHRNTPVAAALTEQEILFGENALHSYVRQPQQVVPYLFPYAAAAACLADTQHEQAGSDSNVSDDFLRVVQKAAQQKYKGHCPIMAGDAEVKTTRFGFAYQAEGAKGDAEEVFISAEELFIRFLNYVKEHSIDGACGLTVSGAAEGAAKSVRNIVLTLVVPRYAFPEAAQSQRHTSRSASLEWLKEAVQSSHLGSVVLHTSVIFSDEASVIAFDGAALERSGERLLSVTPQQQLPAERGKEALAGAPESSNILVVDWGAQGLALSLLSTCGGVLGCPPGCSGIPYLFATRSSATSEESYFSMARCGGGDAVDVALAERVAAQYMTQQRRVFASQGRNLNALFQLNHKLITSGVGEDAATRLIQDAISSRAMRRLALLMGDKKVSLNTNPQAMSVSVEVEAFYEGMDLMDTQTLTRNKLENAIRSEWLLGETFASVLQAFQTKYATIFAVQRVHHVLFTGGLCQMAPLLRLITSIIKAPENSSMFFPSVTPLDYSQVGNGVGADELMCVGGCEHGYRLAVACQRERRAKSVHPRKGMSKARVAALTEESAVATSVWTALTSADAEDDEDYDGDEPEGQEAGAEEDGGLFIDCLQKNVFLFTGDVEELRSAAGEDAPTPGALRVRRAALSLLLPKGAALPFRVVIPWRPSSAEEVVVMYLFTEAPGATNQEGDAKDATALVQPLLNAGLPISILSGEASEKSVTPAGVSIIVTAAAECNEASRKEVHVVVQVASDIGLDAAGLPANILTPGNTSTVKEFTLV